MKHFFIIILLLSLVSACKRDSHQVKEPDASMINKEHPAAIEFEETEYDFGDIAHYEKVTHEFKFTNTGETPLIIVDVSTTCGCTVPGWPEDPIAPGEGGSISVTYDGSKTGDVKKLITVSANTYPKSKTELIIKGHVAN